ncbi:MAG: bile acid:sodium symporter family protein [Succinivibrio sp.]
MAVGVFSAGILGVIFPEFFMTFKALTPYLLGFVMFGMGLGLSFHDFYNVLTNPKLVLSGILLQFILMPAIALVLTRFSHIPPEFATGMLLLGCCPGGTASNVLTYLARGNVALSVSITICTTLLCPIVTPALFYLIAHNTIEVNYLAIVTDILKMVVLPVFIGVLINALLSRIAKKIFIFMPFISSVTVMAIVAIVCSLSAENIKSSSLLIFVVVCCHNILGIAITYLLCKLMRLGSRDCRTLAIEVGTQNSGLSSILSLEHLTAFAAVVGAIFSVVQNIIGSAFANLCNRKEVREEKKVAKYS